MADRKRSHARETPCQHPQSSLERSRNPATPVNNRRRHRSRCFRRSIPRLRADIRHHPALHPRVIPRPEFHRRACRLRAHRRRPTRAARGPAWLPVGSTALTGLRLRPTATCDAGRHVLGVSAPSPGSPGRDRRGGCRSFLRRARRRHGGVRRGAVWWGHSSGATTPVGVRHKRDPRPARSSGGSCGGGEGASAGAVA